MTYKINDDTIIITITPECTSWNPTSNIYKVNKDSYVDSDGDSIESKYIEKYVLNEDETLVETLDLVTLINDYGCDLQCLDEDLMEETSSKFSKFEAECVSDTISNGVLCNEQVKVPEWLGSSPDQVYKCDIHTDVIAFDQAVKNYETKSGFKLSIGSTSIYDTNNIATKSIFKTDMINLGIYAKG